MNDLERLPNASTAGKVTEAILRDGGAIVEAFLSADTVRCLQDDLYPLLAETPCGLDERFAGSRTRRLSRIFARTRHAVDIVTHPLFMGPAKQILQGPVEIWSGDDCVSIAPDLHIGAAQAIQIGPGQGAQPLHRDDAVFLWRHPTYGREARLQIMVALSDFTADNGATLVIPRSHLWDDDRRPERSEAIPAVMQAGSALLFLGSTYHGGGENRSTDQVRTGLTTGLDLSFLRQEENMYLSLPAEVVRSYPEEIQRLLGWSAGRNFLGWIEINGQMTDPIVVLQDAAAQRTSNRL